jgi:hypothetical protein
VLTISASSTPVGVSVKIKYTRVLA